MFLKEKHDSSKIKKFRQRKESFAKSFVNGFLGKTNFALNTKTYKNKFEQKTTKVLSMEVLIKILKDFKNINCHLLGNPLVYIYIKMVNFMILPKLAV